METNYEESYRRIMDTRMKNICVTRKKYGGESVVVIHDPMIIFDLMFSMDSSKVVFLVLWIVSLFTILPI